MWLNFQLVRNFLPTDEIFCWEVFITDEYVLLAKKFSIKDFFSKCDQIHSFPGIPSHLIKKSSMENFVFFV